MDIVEQRFGFRLGPVPKRRHSVASDLDTRGPANALADAVDECIAEGVEPRRDAAVHLLLQRLVLDTGRCA